MPLIRPSLLFALLVLPAGGLAAQDTARSGCDALREARAHAREARALVERHLAEAMRQRQLAARTREEVARAMARARPEMDRALAEARRMRELMEHRRANRGTVDI